MVYSIRSKLYKNTIAGFMLAVGGLAAGAAQAATLTPTSLTFDDTKLNTPSAKKTLTFTNNEPLLAITINSVTFSGTSSGDYTSDSNSTCSPNKSVPVNGSCTVIVIFTPQQLTTSATGPRTATVTVASSSLQNSSLSSTLSGTSPAPVAALSPASIDFGNQAVGGTSAAQVLTLTNAGSGSGANPKVNDLSGITFSTGSSPSDFAVTQGASPCGATLAGSASCTINVTFTPRSTGAKSDTAKVTTSNGGNATSNLTGTGVTGPVAALSTNPVTNPVSVNFGDQINGTTSNVQFVTLTNAGTTDLTSIAIGFTGTNTTDFSQTTNCGTTLVVGTHCAINMQFKPQALGARSASLSVTSNATTATASLSGNGVVGVPIVSLSPAQLDFGWQKNGAVGDAQAVTLQNTGTVSMSISSINIGGTNSGDFAKVNTSTCGTTLAAGASCVVNVTFTPGTLGGRSGTLVFTTNANGSPNGINLAGTGANDSKPVSTPFGVVTLLSDQGTIDTLQTATTSSAAKALPYSYPVGFLTFQVSGVTAGSSVNLLYRLPAGLQTNTYVKCNNAGTTCAVNSTANSLGSQSIMFTVIDGGLDDTDGMANGTVIDPGAPAFNTTVSSSTAVASSSSGAMAWGTLLLLGLPGLMRLRRRRA